MSDSKQSFAETAVVTMPGSLPIIRTEPVDIVVGSGRKGHTYLSWKGDELFELPVSYLTESGEWINSPGYPDGLPNFDKAVVPRCLECHSTYFESDTSLGNRYSVANFVLGITCEKCHGPGKQHVSLNEVKVPSLSEQRASILNPASLSRSGQIEQCALCHAGPGTPLEPAFTFPAGGAVSKYIDFSAVPPEATADVHGHQLQLLESSRCFKLSEMTCSSCHNVHVEQRDPATYSKKCLECHQSEQCGIFASLGKSIESDCIRCHMPLEKTDQITFERNGRQVPVKVRSHRIAIYRDEAF